MKKMKKDSTPKIQSYIKVSLILQVVILTAYKKLKFITAA